MIIDCFSFFNELDILELRLRELDGVVSYFIAVQGEETHAGDLKPMYLNLEDDRWAPWRSRLRSVTVPRIETSDRWIREKAMRHVKKNALAFYQDDDVVILSCVDEIPDVRLLPDLVPSLTLDAWVGFDPACYYYYLNLRTPRSLPGIQFARIDTVRKYGADALEARFRTPPIGPIKGGWHFSYMGGVEAIRTKFASFAHAEYDTEHHRNAEWLESRIAQRLNPFGRKEEPFSVVSIKELPEEVQRHPERYAHMLLAEVTV